MSKTVPAYVKEAINNRLALKDQVINALKKRTKTQTLRDHCYDKDVAKKVLEDFAKTYKYGILPDKLVCYRIFIDTGELGLTFVPVYRCWEFYFKDLDKHSRVVTNFKNHLAEAGFKLKKI